MTRNYEQTMMTATGSSCESTLGSGGAAEAAATDVTSVSDTRAGDTADGSAFDTQAGHATPRRPVIGSPSRDHTAGTDCGPDDQPEP